MFSLHLSQHAQQTNDVGPELTSKSACSNCLLPQKNISHISIQHWWHLGLLSWAGSIVSKENTKFWCCGLNSCIKSHTYRCGLLSAQHTLHFIIFLFITRFFGKQGTGLEFDRVFFKKDFSISLIFFIFCRSGSKDDVSLYLWLMSGWTKKDKHSVIFK